MITKIATHKLPERMIFADAEHEARYWESICPLCHDRDCEETCIFLLPGFEPCKDCNGIGRVQFRVTPVGKAQYNLITICGICEGLGEN